jgi:hypothetical protein
LVDEMIVWEGEFCEIRMTTAALYLRRRTDDIEGSFTKSLAHGIKEDHDKVRSFTCVAEIPALAEPFPFLYATTRVVPCWGVNVESDLLGGHPSL